MTSDIYYHRRARLFSFANPMEEEVKWAEDLRGNLASALKWLHKLRSFIADIFFFDAAFLRYLSWSGHLNSQLNVAVKKRMNEIY